MQIIYDPQKDQLNQQKHAVSLALAHQLEWSILWAFEDDRREYGEKIMIGYAPIDDRVYCVVYVDRGEYRRVISFRKANNREIVRYENWYHNVL